MKRSLWVSCWIMLAFFPLLISAQQRFTASLTSISKDGFYRVSLSPFITAIAQNDLDDLRILDRQGRQVPFIFSQANHGSDGKRWISVPAPKVEQHDSSNSNTYLRFSFDNAYRINKVAIHVTGPRFYKRRISFHQEVYSGGDTFYLSSSHDNSYEIEAKTRTVYCTIFNEDNPPLKIDSIKAWQHYRSIVSYLKKGDQFQLVFGDSTATAPGYDLNFFRDSVSGAVDINIGPVKPLQPPGQKSPPRHKVSNKGLMWLLIVGVLAIMLFVTYRLIKEIKGREKPGKGNAIS